MQVGAVSLNNKINFKASEEEFHFATLKDRDLGQIAYDQACKQVNDKRHKRIDNALFYSLPVVAGLSTLAKKLPPLMQGETPALSIFAPVAKVRGLKLLRAGAVTGLWAAALGALALVAGAENWVIKKSESVRNFVQEHPVISTVGSLVAAVGAVYGANRISGKVLYKLIPSVEKNLTKMTYLDKVLNNSKILNSAEKLIAKIPPSIKSIGATVLNWSPFVVMGTQIAHYFGHEHVKNKQAYKNYNELKEAQDNIRQNIIEEAVYQDVSEQLGKQDA